MATNKGIESGRGNSGNALAARPAIVEIGAGRCVPQIPVDRFAPLRRPAFEFLPATQVAGAPATGADGLLQAEQQAVEIDRYDFRGIERGAGPCIGEPA